MIFDELTVRNYGPFSGRHVLELHSGDPGRHVTLIGAMNGSGKTTVLEATQVALYGRKARGVGRLTGHYDRFLRESIHSGAGSDGSASVELGLRTLRAGRVEQLRISRTWTVRKSGTLGETFDVFRNGEHDEALTETWGDYVESLAPTAVSGLFFFDGERVEELADLDNAEAALRATLGSLIGLDTLARLTEDLRTLERRHTGARVEDDEARLGLEQAANDAEVAAKVVASLELETQAARDAVVRARALLAAVEDRFVKEGGPLFEARLQLDLRLEEARGRVSEIEKRLRELASDSAPLLLVSTMVAELAVAASGMAQAAALPILLDALEERDRRVVERLEELGAGEMVRTALTAELSADRYERRSAVRDEISPRLLTAASASTELRRHGLLNMREQLVAQLRELALATTKRDEAERQVSAVPAADRVADLLDERTQLQESLRLAEARLLRCETELERGKRDQDRAIAARDQLYRRSAETLLAGSDARRIVVHASRVRNTLQELGSRATERHLSRIEQQASEAIRHLLHKQNLITRVALDPKTMSFRLIGSDGRRLAPGRLSAGERQLVALGSLWGLARASGRHLPVMIDTPLGRLDAEHRRLVVSRYLPAASHQVIVLATDTEVDELALSLLQEHVGRMYTIAYDDAVQSSSIRRGGYFEFADAPIEVAA